MKKSKHIITVILFIICQLSIFNSTAQYTKLLDFNGSANGNQPFGSLISDGTFLYGMTEIGGTNNGGTIFKMKPDGTGYVKIFDFSNASGSSPLGALFSDGTFLYGMTQYNGANNFGTIFKIKPDGTGFSKLLDFDGTTNGQFPIGSFISDGTYLYGTTEQGGATGNGTIFKIKPDGTGFTKLLDFAGTTGGSSPLSSLVSDGTYLYGTTWGGGTNDYGTLFKIMPDGTGYAKLLDFNGINGMHPYSSLILDGTYLYGTTEQGGTNSMGAVFKIKPDGTGYTKLFDFSGTANGKTPYGSLFSDGTFLYGMTSLGGSNDDGVIYKIMSDGTGYSKLFNFTGTANGASPEGTFILIGNFIYGMTGQGGTSNMGTLFKFNPYCSAVTLTQTKTFCAGHSFSVTVGNHTYSTIGTYIDVLRAVNTCDSIVTTHIRILGSILAQSPTVCAGQSVTVGSHTYSASGTYTDVFTSLVNSCDSTVTTHLTILPANSFTQSKTVCSGQNITVGSHTYNSNGNYTDVFTSLISGCDSTVTTHLTVLSSSASSFSQTFTKCAGQSVTVGTVTYSTSGTYTYLFFNNGCDSIVTTHLTVLPANTFTQSFTKCAGQSVTVGNHVYAVSGIYHDTLTSFVNGCDSMVTTHLTIKPANTFTQTLTKCAGQSVTIGNHIYSVNGTYHDTLTSLVNGCDSTVISHLTVLFSSGTFTSQTLTKCAGQSVFVGSHTHNTTGTYHDTLRSGSCDSAITTHLTVLSANIDTVKYTVCAGQSITVGNHVYSASGTDTRVLTSLVNGCDSTVITRITVLPANAFTQSLTVCTGKSITVGSHTYTASGTYTDVFSSLVNGCDSTVTTHLIILPANTFTQSHTICGGSGQSVIVGIHTYNVNGTYIDTLTSPNGCDSVVITHLTVLSSSIDSSSQTFTKCAGQSVTVGTATYTISGTYTYHFSGNVCDSVVTTHLTVLPANAFTQSPNLCAGQCITIGSHTYTASGTYTDLFTSLVNGCDSIVTTHLTINDTSVSVSGVILTANAIGATYQWINCNNGNMPITGQTNQSFTATSNGSYAVVVTQNLCSGTSSCHNITTVGIAENSFATTVNIYPNPFTSQTNISFSEEQKNTRIKIMDVLGKEISTRIFTGKELIIEKGEMKAGIYFLQIIDVNKNMVNKKIVVQ